MTTANTTIAAPCEGIKILPVFFFVRSAKIYIFLICCVILVINLCVPWDEKGWNRWSSGWEKDATRETVQMQELRDQQLITACA